VSAHLQWTVVWNCSSFLIKRNKQTYGTEPNDQKTVGVGPAADGGGVVVVVKRISGRRKPATRSVRTTINKNARASLGSTRHMIRKNKYRPDLRMAAILRSQKQEYWSGLPCPPPEDLPHSGIESTSLCLLHWQVSSLPLALPGKPGEGQSGDELLSSHFCRNLGC
uniref:Large ribosomal subunit protein eL28 n=1 Tax=Moschus moschiferus TaxID=68415 RepID=A0A8C6DVJ2_MOSMO